MMASADDSIRRFALGKRTPKDQIRIRERMVDSPISVSGTVIRNQDQSVLRRRIGRDDADKIMSVAMRQPHRRGVSAYPDDAWMATPLGRFCRSRWNDRGTQKARWDDGERYAQLIDCERIARGETPRQCAEGQKAESTQTVEEALKKRREAEADLADAEDAMREVDNRAVRAVRELAWAERDIPDDQHGRAFNALYKLSVYFERKDKRR